MESPFPSLRSALLFVCLAVPLPALGETRLVMAEEAGCFWCARWNAEVGDAYDLTAEGRAAPLVRVDIHGELPSSLSFANRLVYTPTFVLMRDGHEISRLEGYPGEDFFWALFQNMLDDAGIDWRDAEAKTN